MSSSGLSKNCSFYQIACHTTDTFTSCIGMYEALLPYFEAGRSDDGVNRRLFNIGGMLTILYNELTTLKNEIASALIVAHDDDDDDDDDHNASEQVVESKGLTKVVNEHNQQKNICEASAMEQKKSRHEKMLDKLSKRSLEDLHQRGKVNPEDKNMEKTIPHDEEVLLKPTQTFEKQTRNFEYLCGNCSETLTVYNQDLDLSIALHILDGCCRGNPSKLVSVKKKRQEEKVDKISAQGQVQNLTKYQEATDRPNLIPAQTDTVYKVEDTHLSCMLSLGNRFLCIVCNKYLTGPKNFDEHVKGNYHQECLKQSGKETEKITDNETEVMCAQAIKSCEKTSPAAVVQEESTLSEKIDFDNIIKSLSG